MSDETLELDRDVGHATITYEHPEEGTVERTVANEQIAYFQDHWTLKAGEDESGNDIVRRIPAQRVHYVDRSVQEFEEEVRSLRKQVQSVADEIRTRLPLGGRDDEEESSGTRGGDADEDPERRGDPDVERY